MAVCAGCGVELHSVGRGRPRKWCSERCRKHASYVGVCEVCGATTYNSDATPPRFCRAHYPTGIDVPGSWPAVRHARAHPFYERFSLRWREGATTSDLATEFGMSKGHVSVLVHKLRSLGYSLPYRYTMRDGKRVSTSDAASKLPGATTESGPGVRQHPGPDTEGEAPPMHRHDNRAARRASTDARSAA